MVHPSRPTSLILAALTTATILGSSQALVGPQTRCRPIHSLAVTASVSDEAVNTAETASADPNDSAELTHKGISNLRFRELKHELQSRGLAEDGTTSQLRGRLRAAIFPGEECIVTSNGEEECGPEGSVSYNQQVGWTWPDRTFIWVDLCELSHHTLSLTFACSFQQLLIRS